MTSGPIPRLVELRGWGETGQMCGPIKGAGREGRRP